MISRWHSQLLDHGDGEPIRGMVVQPQSERLLRGPTLVLLPDSGERLAFRLLPFFPRRPERPCTCRLGQRAAGLSPGAVATRQTSGSGRCAQPSP